MPKLITVEDEVNELRRSIKILEWDIPNIQNKDLKALKMGQLLKLKQKMEGLVSSLSEMDE
jgi:hypothetical protein